MLYKLIGAIIIVLACGGVGFQLAAQFRSEEKSLYNLLSILDFMECQLRYQLTPLPTLCREVATVFPQVPGHFFSELSRIMESQQIQDVESCVCQALNSCGNIPDITKIIISDLGKTIGRFDLDGQLKGLAAAKNECKRNLNILATCRETRLRSYQTLGLCAGAAIAILLI